MTTTTRFMTLEDYLAYEDDADTCYELEDGALLVMPPESERNRRIASFLLAYFIKLGIPFYRLSTKTEVAVSGTRATVRLPDLVVMTEDLAIALSGASRSTVMLDMPPPHLIVEVVSPGKKNEDRDYRYKRSQYQARGIEEYWIIDPMQQRITVLNLINGLYEEAVFEREEAIASTFLQSLEVAIQLTTAQVFQAGSST